jgi:hypothetical protein
VTQAEVVFCECKLNNKRTKSPWAAQGDGAAKRMDVYREYFPEVAGVKDWRNVYQLIRQYVYAKKLGIALNKPSQVIPLVNEIHLPILEKTYSPLLGTSAELACVFRPLLTWQGLTKILASSILPDAPQIIKKLDETLAAVK